MQKKQIFSVKLMKINNRLMNIYTKMNKNTHFY